MCTGLDCIALGCVGSNCVDGVCKGSGCTTNGCKGPDCEGGGSDDGEMRIDNNIVRILICSNIQAVIHIVLAAIASMSAVQERTAEAGVEAAPDPNALSSRAVAQTANMVLAQAFRVSLKEACSGAGLTR